jgi:dienelactone hydrolase
MDVPLVPPVDPPAEPTPRPTLRQRIRRRWNQLAAWWSRTWSNIRPGPEARKGAAWAVIAAAAWAAIVGGIYLESGFGRWIDFLFAFAIAAIGIPLIAILVAFLLTILRRLPRLATGFILGGGMFISLAFGPIGPVFAAVVTLIECVLGATLATFLFGHFRQATLSKKIITAVLFAASLAGNIWLYRLLSSEGQMGEIMQLKETASPPPAQLAASNPATPGPYAIKFLTYGNGTDIRRPEYGKPVAIRTATVDASPFFKDFTGWKANLRKRYWGFGMDKLPLNGRVWYPDGPGPFPLVLIVHGNHNMADFSDPGYQYLGELLASRGFILASIDENFLNSGLFHDPPKQQAVRGWMLLEHLKQWRNWNSTRGNPFYHKVDVANVALMGHSRGGEAVATAALFNQLDYYPDDATIRFNYRFPIKSLVAIAPVDGQYKPAEQWRVIQNVSYFTIQGANDGDVSSFDGSRQFDHVHYTGPGPWFKSELYIYRANHGQFNSVWGRSDAGEPLGWFLNLKPLLDPGDQRKIAKTYISAFLEATLHKRSEYLPMFRDYRRIRSWLPDTLYMNRYLDASYRVISDFSEDADVTTTTVPGGHLEGENLSIWREGRIPYRQGDRGYNGVFLGWNRAEQKKGQPSPIPLYTISLPATLAKEWSLGPKSVLTMSLAVTEDKADPPWKKPGDKSKDEPQDKNKKPEPTDFTVEIETSDGAVSRFPLSHFGVLPPPFTVHLTKFAKLDEIAYEKASEPIFQTIDLPLAAFAVDAAKIKTIRLRFDRTLMRVVILSQLGFSQ